MKGNDNHDFRKIALIVIMLVSVLNIAGGFFIYGNFSSFFHSISAKASDNSGELSLVIETSLAPSVPAPPEVATIGGGAPKKSECADGIDNDKDGRVDFPADKGCISFADNREEEPAAEIPPIPSDVRIEIEELEPSEEGVPAFEITLTNLGEGILTVFIKYTIINKEGDILIETAEKRRTLLNRLILGTEFEDISLEPGDYNLVVDLRYGERTAHIEKPFTIEEPLFAPISRGQLLRNLTILAFILAALLALIAIYLIWKLFSSGIGKCLEEERIRDILRRRKTGYLVCLTAEAVSYKKIKEGFMIKLEDSTGYIYAIARKKEKGMVRVRGKVLLDEDKNKYLRLRSLKIAKEEILSKKRLNKRRDR